MKLSDAPEADVIDMTELATAIAELNGEAPPSGPVFVPASTFPVSEKIKRDRIENPEVGDKMPDGTTYIGQFKDVDGVEKKWFAAAKDATRINGERFSLTFNEASAYAANSQVHGHNDWAVPTGWFDNTGAPDILGAMFNSRSKGAFTGTFNEEDSDQNDDQYWSASPNANFVGFLKTQCFSDGEQTSVGNSLRLSIRLVRSVPVPRAAP